MTVNLSLILKKKKTRIQKPFPLSTFVFIDSLVVSDSQDASGHTLSRQNNLTFGIGLHVVSVRTVVRTVRHNQIFSDRFSTKLSYPWCCFANETYGFFDVFVSIAVVTSYHLILL